jgi:hypothetical protein
MSAYHADLLYDATMMSIRTSVVIISFLFTIFGVSLVNENAQSAECTDDRARIVAVGTFLGDGRPIGWLFKRQGEVTATGTTAFRSFRDSGWTADELREYANGQASTGGCN